MPLGPGWGLLLEPCPHPSFGVQAALCVQVPPCAQGPRSAQELQLGDRVPRSLECRQTRVAPTLGRLPAPPGSLSYSEEPSRGTAVLQADSHTPRSICLDEALFLAWPSAHQPLQASVSPHLPPGVGVHSAFLKWGWVRMVACPPPGQACSSLRLQRRPLLNSRGRFAPSVEPPALLPAPAPPPAWPYVPPQLNGPSVCLPLAGPRPTLGGGSGSWLAQTPRGLKSWKMQEFPTFFSRFSPAQMQSCRLPAGWPPFPCIQHRGPLSSGMWPSQ